MITQPSQQYTVSAMSPAVIDKHNNKPRGGAIGLALLWLLGIPLPILLIIFLIMI